jgi:hypothetical protein
MYIRVKFNQLFASCPCRDQVCSCGLRLLRKSEQASAKLLVSTGNTTNELFIEVTHINCRQYHRVMREFPDVQPRVHIPSVPATSYVYHFSCTSPGPICSGLTAAAWNWNDITTTTILNSGSYQDYSLSQYTVHTDRARNTAASQPSGFLGFPDAVLAF